MNPKSIKSSALITPFDIVQNKASHDGFVMLLRVLESVVPTLGGQLLDLVIIASKLFLKPTDSLCSFHSKAVDVKNDLLTVSMAHPPHESLQRCLGQLSTCPVVK